MTAPLLEVQDLKVHYPVRTGWLSRRKLFVRAVDGVSFALGRGETLGLVGESGCGKSTLGNAILRIVEPTAGSIRFKGEDVTAVDRGGLHRLRRHMQMIFQDPYSSLNPKLPVGEAIGEPLRVRGLLKGRALAERVAELLTLVGLGPEHRGRYPHEFSGGQRQRLVIARALALSPDLIVCDEPVSALDVSIRSQILNLLVALQQRLGMAYVFISHDLSVIRHISDRVVVMYLGHVVEVADRDVLFARPLHPYTQALISAIPLPDPQAQRAKRRIILKGELPSPTEPLTGCPFHTRCPLAEDRCRHVKPALERKASGAYVACHLVPPAAAAAAA
ncbi:MAG: dipeptide ABC transporter ATP-binding protein [Proteobacteria bacterium]|nr:dipeptide ABC transporter ATP-binding protein [Pseudomonadota bacterium]